MNFTASNSSQMTVGSAASAPAAGKNCPITFWAAPEARIRTSMLADADDGQRVAAFDLLGNRSGGVGLAVGFSYVFGGLLLDVTNAGSRSWPPAPAASSRPHRGLGDEVA